ncbi:MAG: MaoC family dehydratase [Halanaeroarchaeum sp.]
MTTYFEDFSEGDTESFGAYEVTAEEILAFAEQYDPQWFHTDEERAESESIYGGLIASGWHTAAMTMRMIVDHHLHDAAALGALGVDELRWPTPVRPGETLSVETEVLETRPSESDPSRGVVRTHSRTVNQDGQSKLTMTSIVLYATREHADKF